jgi:hypothetical protein
MAAGSMTVEEREAFLADVHVGVLAIDEPGRGPLALPVWYQFVDGVVVVGMDGDSLKARLLRAAGRATLVAQTEAPPYAYVSVEGPVEVVPDRRDDNDMATRYLGPELGAWYGENNPRDESSVLARLTPEHWRTTDFGKLFSDVAIPEAGA